jgi:hypothetical protein
MPEKSRKRGRRPIGDATLVEHAWQLLLSGVATSDREAASHAVRCLIGPTIYDQTNADRVRRKLAQHRSTVEAERQAALASIEAAWRAALVDALAGPQQKGLNALGHAFGTGTLGEGRSNGAEATAAMLEQAAKSCLMLADAVRTMGQMQTLSDPKAIEARRRAALAAALHPTRSGGTK